MNNCIPFFLIVRFISFRFHRLLAMARRVCVSHCRWNALRMYACDTNLLRLLYLALNFRHFRVQSTNFFNVTLLTFRTSFFPFILWFWFICLLLHCNCFCSFRSRETFPVNIHFKSHWTFESFVYWNHVLLALHYHWPYTFFFFVIEKLFDFNSIEMLKHLCHFECFELQRNAQQLENDNFSDTNSTSFSNCHHSIHFSFNLILR